jgi:hypothetical protein
MSIKNALKKAASLLVEFPEEPEENPNADLEAMTESPKSVTKTVEQIVQAAPGPNLSDITIPEEKVASSIAPGGAVNFQNIYNNAGLTPAPFTAENALEVIASLPPELPLSVKRSTVQATLSAMGKAMGVNTETVVADASRKLAALSAYEDMLTHQTEGYVSKLSEEIKTHEERIAALNGEINKTKQLLTSALDACNKEGDRLDDVLEFFTLDVGVSKNA